MPWTRQQQIRHLIRLPWSVRVEREPDGSFVGHVQELPFVTATGDDEGALARDLFDALHTALDALLEHGDPIPVPHSAILPWTSGAEPPAERQVIVAKGRLQGSAWEQASPDWSAGESLAIAN